MRRRTLLAGAGAAAVASLSVTRRVLADTLDDVKKRGTLVVGTEAEYVPYEFYKDGKIVGYDPDIIQILSTSSASRHSLSTPPGTASSRRSTPVSSTSSSPA